jgi:hypothetical protein
VQKKDNLPLVGAGRDVGCLKKRKVIILVQAGQAVDVTIQMLCVRWDIIH